MGIVRSKYYGIMRGITVGISFFLQIALMIFLGMYLMRYSIIVYFVLELVSVIIVFALVNNAESYITCRSCQSRGSRWCFHSCTVALSASTGGHSSRSCERN